MSRTHLVRHAVTIEAPAERCYALIADLDAWAQHFAPAVHAEILERADDGAELVRRWALTGDSSVHTWDAWRRMDPEAARIVLDQVEPDAPLASMRATWTFSSEAASTTEVVVTHEFTLRDDSPEDAARTVTEELDGRTPGQLESLRQTATAWEELEPRVISFEDPLFIGGRLEDVYEFLYAADKWPERVPHVGKLDLTEKTPGIQFFDMHTETPDGRAHTTRSVRICLPHNKIVYKQTGLPALLDAHTGHWVFVETPEGVVAHARHTATIKPSALPLLGEGTTVADARRYLRRVLSTNSLQTLRYAQQFAEERARAGATA
ncbi:aromatase/cyclase [Streptomyces minutiscleroticus]|uniref:Actinorhodin polyketide synthase bifunctional cyclase/dehydratase n=2 Tax=Streptomyces TaxID=1883 RepID=A0A918NLY6_9ACTN|nr:aromatase/cyclase [Streptomyces minutiscleroticus]AXB74590.1 aromatase [Streptomyces roseiscleroticus]GGX79782.1 actinorhodin polyketide synthase bifunctional cyclase/dehydratase [Streptomyces minutiscleroticus]